MLYLNRVQLLGNMGQAPEFGQFPSGDEYCSFSVCTTEKWKDRNTGELQEKSEWTRVKVREKYTVDYLKRFAQKGVRVFVEGMLRNIKIAGKNGADDRYFTEVDASLVSLEGRPASDEQKPRQSASEQPRAPRPVPQQHAAPQRRVQQEPSGFENDDALNQLPRF